MIARGPAYLWNKTASDWAVLSFADAFEQVRHDLETAASLSDTNAEVSAAHLAMLEDPMLREAVEAEMNAGKSELVALGSACNAICAMFSGIDDEYLRARVDDVRDVFGRIRAAMCGGEEASDVPAGSILVAEELLPSDFSRIDFSRLAGIICRRGSSTSHICILSRSIGVPIRVGADISGIRNGDTVEVDDPLAGGPQTVAAQVRAAGRKVYVNAAGIEDIRAAMAAGADGIGVLRTEFMFMGRESVPSRREQREIYLEAMEICGGKTLIIRLLDVGGDKALPYLPMPREDNPFLGVRGVRFGLAHPELYKAQLGAIADAAAELRKRHPEWFAAGSPVRVMIPMVCTVEEIRRVRQILNVILSVSEGSAPLVSLGIMIETPAAVLDASALAAECDFFSLGTNDLTQYVMAADRGNAAVADLYDPLSPAVRRAVELTVAAAHSADRPAVPTAASAAAPAVASAIPGEASGTPGRGIPVGICGELASDPRATAFLLAAGLDSFSLSHL